jgi:sulfoxide reductase heme-binding subunit YedZ
VIRVFKVAVFLVCLAPLGMLGWRALHADLGANPLEVITHTTGDWTLRFLVITLAVTPLRQITKQYWLIKFRRMLGLYAFFYGLLHLTTYLWFDKFFDWAEIVKDIGKRPFITVGFSALVIMLPLALTSTKGMIRRLGKRWQQLHRLVYASAIAGVIHYYWLVKADIRRPVTYGIFVLALLLYALRGRTVTPLKSVTETEI